MNQRSSRSRVPAVRCAACQSSCLPNERSDWAGEIIAKIVVKALLPPLTAFVGLSVSGYLMGFSEVLIAIIGILGLGIGLGQRFLGQRFLGINNSQNDLGYMIPHAARSIDEDM